MAEEEEKKSLEEVATAVSEGALPRTKAVLRVIFIFLVVALCIWILYLVRAILFLIVLSIFFAHIIAPLVDLAHRVMRLKPGPRGRMAATGSVYLVILILFGLATSLLLPIIGDQMTELIKQAPSYIQQVQKNSESLRNFYARYRVPTAFRRTLDHVTERSLEAAADYARKSLVRLARYLTYFPFLFLVPILAFFFLKDAEFIQRSLLMVLPRGSMRWRGRELLEDTNRTIASYIRAQLVAGAFIGAVCTIGFELLGLPYAVILGTMAGILEFIPLAGPVIVAVIASILAGFHSVSQVVGVLLFLGVLRVFEDYIIFPRIIGRGIHMHPLVTILAILCGAEIGGVIGIFLAVPLIAIFTVGYRHWMAHSGGEGIVESILNPAADKAPACEPCVPPQVRAPESVAPPPPHHDRQEDPSVRPH